jgi:hypothetical protein
MMTTTPPEGITAGAFYQLTRQELLAGLKLAAEVRKAINRSDRKQRPALRAEHFPRLVAAQRRLAFYRKLIWCGDRMVFTFGWQLAVGKCAAAIRTLEELAQAVGLERESDGNR